jgi:SAM-dependent methyltransferase
MTETRALRFDASNTEQVRAWDGDEGGYWAEHADDFDRAVAPHHARLMAAAAIGAAERVLDLGCGTGQTTRDAARAASAGVALGTDLSAAMLDVARRRAVDEGLANVRFEQVDAQIHPFEPAAYDVVISRTGATFFGDLVAAYTNIGRAVRPGGRLALLTWRGVADNEWFREFATAMAAGRDVPSPPPGAPGPFTFADPDHARTVLTTAGFADIELEAVDAPMWFGRDVDAAHRLVSGLLGWMLEGLDDEQRAHALDALRTSMAAHQTADGVRYPSAAWLIRARRP